MMKPRDIYFEWWRRKELLHSQPEHVAIAKWWQTNRLCEIERIIFEKIKNQTAILDVGAGDLRIMKKFQKAGFSGEYHTLDIGKEFNYTYANLEEVRRSYPCILFFDVLEHLSLSKGLETITTLVNLLEPGGTLIIQTANSRCVRNPLSWDMTHIHCYNISDLGAYLTSLGLSTHGYRVIFEPEHKSYFMRLKSLISKYIITRFIGLDYADNIVLFARKSK